MLEEYVYTDGIKISDGNYGSTKTVKKYLNQKIIMKLQTEYLYDKTGRVVKVTNPQMFGVRTSVVTSYYMTADKECKDARGNSTCILTTIMIKIIKLMQRL